MTRPKKEWTTLCLRKIKGRLSEKETIRFEQWIQNDPDHQAFYESLKTLFPHEPAQAAFHADWRRAWKRFHAASEKDSQVPARYHLKYLYSGALIRRPAAVVFSLIAVLILLGLVPGNPAVSWIFETRVHTGPGTQRRVTLPDGSTVSLNAGSSIRFRKHFSASGRRIFLRGEAFFDVRPGAECPFVVVTANAQTLVMGTQFNVWARHEQTRVIVRKGKVRLSHRKGDAYVDLTANQMSRVRRKGIPAEPDSVIPEERIGWLRGRLVFERASLTEITGELERQFDIRIVIPDHETGSRTMTATFNMTEPESIMQAICRTMDLVCEQRENHMILREK